MAICILAVTGIRINELLPLKVKQLNTLLEEGWIAIDRSKRGPSNHKAFLNKKVKEGYPRIKKRLEDGIHPLDVSKKSTGLGKEYFLIKSGKGR